MELNKKIIFCILIVSLYSAKATAKSFELLGVYDKNKIRLFFPTFKAEEISRINCIQLDKDIRPGSWTDRIPFGAFIDKKNNKVFYSYYGSFFNKKIKEVKFEQIEEVGSYKKKVTEFLSPEDVCLSRRGDIFVADSLQDRIFHFQLDSGLEKNIYKSFIEFKGPVRCELDRKNRLFVLNKEGRIKVFLVQNNNYIESLSLSEKINRYLKNKNIIDLSISRRGDIYVLTQNEILRFSRYGQLSGRIKVENGFVGIENSYYGDVYILNADKRFIRKYSLKLEALKDLYIEGRIEGELKDISIYDSFGYIAVCSLLNGAYFGMGVQLENISFRRLERKKSDLLEFKITFASDITVEILDERKKVLRKIMDSKKLLSGTHKVYWDKKDGSGKNVTGNKIYARVTAKGRYSMSNTDIKVVPIES